MEENNTIITIKDKNKTISIEINTVLDIFKMFEELRGLLIAYGYNPESVISGAEYLIEQFDEKGETKNK